MECVKDRYDRLAEKFLAEHTDELMRNGAFDGRPDAHFLRTFTPVLGRFLRAEMPESSKPKRRGRPPTKGKVSG